MEIEKKEIIGISFVNKKNYGKNCEKMSCGLCLGLT
jgi:hypothetical protein